MKGRHLPSHQAMLAAFPEAVVQEAQDQPDGSAYVCFRLPGFFSGTRDAVEFLVRPTAAEGRDWEGDAPGGLLVLMRSSAEKVRHPVKGCYTPRVHRNRVAR